MDYQNQEGTKINRDRQREIESLFYSHGPQWLLKLIKREKEKFYLNKKLKVIAGIQFSTHKPFTYVICFDIMI